MTGSQPRVAVVGPCSSGKSSLVRRLRRLGFDARHCAQEHSYVPDMWRRIARPNYLVYLDVGYAALALRHLPFGFNSKHLAEQYCRLAHARQHCDLYLFTDDLSPDDVLQRVLSFLESA